MLDDEDDLGYMRTMGNVFLLGPCIMQDLSDN